MPRFAANLTMLVTELPFTDRLAAAQLAEAGLRWLASSLDRALPA